MIDATLLDLDGLNSLIETMKVDVGRLENELAMARADLAAVYTERSKRLNAKCTPKVSDHAVLRYIERIHGVDVEGIRDLLLTPAVRRAIAEGAASVVCADMVLCIKNGHVATVLPPRKEPRPARADRREQIERARARDAADEIAEAAE